MKTLSIFLILISLKLTAQDFCFENIGLKSPENISFTLVGSEIKDGEWQKGGDLPNTSAETYFFYGKKVGNKLNIAFTRLIPYTLPTHTKDIVWALENGVLKIPMNEKNHVSNRFENTITIFTKCQPSKSDDYEAKIPETSACNCDAYVIDKDQNGLNVRENGNKNAKIVTKIPFQLDGAMVHIKGTNNNGWVMLSEAKDANDKSILSQSGYVFAQKLGISIGGYEKGKVNLYSLPTTKSRVETSISSELSATILDCKDGWLKIKYANKTGWLRPEDQCANPNSNCN